MPNVDMAGDTLIVQDIQVGATMTGSTGSSLSSNPGGLLVLSGTTAPSGGSSGAVAMTIGTGATSSLGVYFGAGAPSGLTAHQGSVYLNTTGSSISTRMYINTTGVSTWTAVSTLA